MKKCRWESFGAYENDDGTAHVLAVADGIDRVFADKFTDLDSARWTAEVLNEALAAAEQRRQIGIDKLTLTVPEAARLLGISRMSAYAAVREGPIPCLKVGRRILVPRSALDRLLAQADPQRETLAR
jgi:excisionase family DNA binding protein